MSLVMWLRVYVRSFSVDVGVVDCVFCVTFSVFFFFFFFKQKTAYEIGTGDWSSDVCSSDLYVVN